MTTCARPVTLLAALFFLTFSSHAVVSQTDLGGTEWRLVQFKSSDDTTLTPDDRSKYTLSFGTNGTVTARVDCNRGRGTWRSVGRDQLRFGAMAMTRAMCPRGSLHNRIVRDFRFIRSYVMKDGHLFLSLRADGGIYEYEPLAGSDIGESLFGPRWTLTEIRGATVKTTNAYIEFIGSTGRFSGNGGCNRVAGNYQINGANIKFSEAISTKRACIDRDLQRIETEFFAALEESTRFELKGNFLRLFAGNRQLLTLRSLSTPEPPQTDRVTGTVTYRQRVALSPRAVVEVRLIDVSRADGPSITIAEQKIETRGRQVPIPFELTYDPKRIDPRSSYTIRVRIFEGTRLRFTSTTAYPVITNNHPNTVNVVVAPVRR